MSMAEKLEQLAQSPSFLLAAIGLIGGGIWWVIRKIFLLEQAKAVIEKQMAVREAHVNQRFNEVNRSTEEMHKDVREIRDLLSKGSQK